nr:PorT family protein [Chitinophagaceae bacterium]
TKTNHFIDKDVVKKSKDKIKHSPTDNQNNVDTENNESKNVNENKISSENIKSSIEKTQINNLRKEESITKSNNKRTKSKLAKSGNDNVKDVKVEEVKESIANNNYKSTSTLETTKKQEPKLINPSSLSALNPRYVKGLENYTSTRNNDTVELSPAQIENLIAKNNIETTLPQNATSIKKPIKVIDKSKAGFFTDVQLNYSKGFKKSINNITGISNPSFNPINDEPVKWSIAPYLGVGYRFPISNRFDFFGSLAWTMQNNLNIDDYSYKIKYGFGKDSSSMIVNRKSQIQLEMPLQIGFKINNSSMLIGGFGINYGLDVFSSVKEFETESFKNQFGYRSGVNSFDVIALFGYAYQINKDFILQVNYSRGFIDKTNNTYFNNTNQDNTQRFSIGMRYMFKSKK